MIPPRCAMRLALWVTGSCFLAGWALAQDEAAPQQLMRSSGPLGDLLCSGIKPSDPSCPRKKKAATLVPSFTKTTTPSTTHHSKTTHRPTTHTTNHTTRSTANHTTPHPTNHTTRSPANHTTPHPTNHTTPNHATVPANHTMPHPTNHTTPNHTTPFHTAAPINHTTPHPPTNHTTPAGIITTLPRPTDTPLVAIGNYVVKNGSTTCLRLEAGLEIQVQYTNKAKQWLWGAFAVQPNHTNRSGACSSEANTLELRFPEGFLIFVFKKNETKGRFYLSRVQATLTYQFVQATETSFGADTSSLQEFEASLGHSYQCRNRTLALTRDFHLRVLNERVQAFELQDGEFGKAEVCREEQHFPLVPIIVIVVLVILVVIVIVAYAVGRRRSHGGYEAL